VVSVLETSIHRLVFNFSILGTFWFNMATNNNAPIRPIKTKTTAVSSADKVPTTPELDISSRLNCTKFGELILRKIIKILATRSHFLKLECTKFDFG